jgi:hypothetical protein
MLFCGILDSVNFFNYYTNTVSFMNNKLILTVKYWILLLFIICAHNLFAGDKYEYTFYVHPSDTAIHKEHFFPVRKIDTVIYSVVFVFPSKYKNDEAILKQKYGLSNFKCKINYSEHSQFIPITKAKYASSYTIVKNDSLLFKGSIAYEFTRGIVQYYNALNEKEYKITFPINYFSDVDEKLYTKSHFIYTLNKLLGIRRVDLANKTVMNFKITDSIVQRTYRIFYDSLSNDNFLRLYKEWFPSKYPHVNIGNYIVTDTVVWVLAEIPIIVESTHSGMMYKHPVVFKYSLNGNYINTYIMNRQTIKLPKENTTKYTTLLDNAFFINKDTIYLYATSFNKNENAHHLAKYYLNNATQRCEFLDIINCPKTAIYKAIQPHLSQYLYCHPAQKYMLSFDYEVRSLHHNDAITKIAIFKHDLFAPNFNKIPESVVQFYSIGSNYHFITKTSKGDFYYKYYKTGDEFYNKEMLLNNRNIINAVFDEYNKCYVNIILDEKNIIRKYVEQD